MRKQLEAGLEQRSYDSDEAGVLQTAFAPGEPVNKISQDEIDRRRRANRAEPLQVGSPAFERTPNHLSPREQLIRFARALNGEFDPDLVLGGNSIRSKTSLWDIGINAFRRLVDAWESSGKNWNNREVWGESEFSPDILQSVMERYLRPRLELCQGAFGDSLSSYARARISLGSFAPPKEVLELIGDPEAPQYLWFAQFLLNPDLHYWGGRCSRCELFYVKSRANQKAYCSRQCGAKSTSKKSKEEKRARAFAEKLAAAERASSDWQTSTREGLRRQESWKSYVTREAGVSSHWLARQINIGTLLPPN